MHMSSHWHQNTVKIALEQESNFMIDFDCFHQISILNEDSEIISENERVSMEQEDGLLMTRQRLFALLGGNTTLRIKAEVNSNNFQFQAKFYYFISV